MDDKLQHFLAYGGLGGVLGFALWTTFPNRRVLPFVVFGVALVYGALDEVTQAFVGRTPDVDDWLADAAGAAAGILPAAILQRVFEQRFSGWINGPSDDLKTAEEAEDPGVALAPELEAALDAYGVEEKSTGVGPAVDRRRVAGTVRQRKRRAG
jgi:hypothetical protein